MFLQAVDLWPVLGLVTLRSSVDHEQTESVNVTVRATDTGSPALSSLAIIHVEIEDVNDNSPEWTTFPHDVTVSTPSILHISQILELYHMYYL